MICRQFEPKRAVEVVAPKYGSAYRIGGRLLLTAAHLVSEVGSACRVRAKQTIGEIGAIVVWKAHQDDVALIKLPESIEPCEPVVFGRLPVTRGGEKIDFQMYGWPKWAQTVRDENRSAAGGRQIEGLIYLADSSPDGLLVLEAQRLPPEVLAISGSEQVEGDSGGVSEWEGASGAAVICDGLIVAVQRQHQNPKRTASLEAESLSKIYEDRQWRALLTQHAISPEPQILRVKGSQITIPYLSRREFLSSLLVGVGAIAVEQLPNISSSHKQNNILLRWKQLIDPEPAIDFSIDDLMLFFGAEPSQCGIIPGNSNKHLVAQGKFRASRYVQLAFDNSCAALKGVLGVRHTEPIVPTDARMEAHQYRNLLILGGPVASPETRLLCGYREIPTETSPDKLLPEKLQSSILPYHFYCGNRNGWGYWGTEERKAKRWLDDGTEKKLPLYGIIDSTQSTILEPPMNGERLAGDMLIVTRLPNLDATSGSSTIVGGMHGYSIEAFFKNLTQNLKIFNEVFCSHNYDYFQAILPVKISENREVAIDWLGKGNWKPNIIKVERNSYLASLSHFETIT